MIQRQYVTVTPNPCFDVTVQTGKFAFEEPNRVYREQMVPAGKGVNVSRVFAAHGLPTVTIAVLGRESLEAYRDGLPPEMDLRPVPTDGAVRQNLTLCSDDGKTVKINRPGAAYTKEAHKRLCEELKTVLREGDLCAICGSLPSGMDAGHLQEAARTAQRQGVRLALDSEGLTRSLLRAVKPFVIKPNQAELARLFGQESMEEADCLAAAEELTADGVQRVIVSLGEAGLAVVSREGCVRVWVPRVEAVSAVAAGDSALAGYLMCADNDEQTAARWAAAYGTAAVLQSGSGVGDRETAQRLYPQITASLTGRF